MCPPRASAIFNGPVGRSLAALIYTKSQGKSIFRLADCRKLKKKLGVFVASSSITFVSNFVRTSQLVQIRREGNADSHSVVISPASLFHYNRYVGKNRHHVVNNYEISMRFSNISFSCEICRHYVVYPCVFIYPLVLQRF
jgi:hypothetical protein